LCSQLNYTITGSDASSGEMGKAKKMLAAYGLKEKISN
jgi:glycine betaine/proline transport system substrate-binding protein